MIKVMIDAHPRSTPTFAIETLGCKVNQADSEAIAAALLAQGFAPVREDVPADVVVVNTCTVTHLGDRSSRQAISQARRAMPDALVVATGCYAQVAPDEVGALPGVGMVVANAEKDGIAARIATALAEKRSLPLPLAPIFPEAENPDRLLADMLNRTRAQIKVQDGCDNRCTYCIVPTARGASRSRAIADVVRQAQRKEAAGIREIVLTGVHLGDYHPAAGEDLGDLLAALLRETGISRIRVSSLEPEDFRLDWLALWQNPRLCRHLHLPMQSGSDAVLRKMARRYLSERYREIARAAHAAIPGLALTTDIIVGFPNETDDDFARTYEMAAELRFAKMHVFRFSPRAGTAAARMRGRIAPPVAHERSERLLALGAQLATEFRSQHLGQRASALWESRHPWGWEGLTDNYIRVELHDGKYASRDLRHACTETLIVGLTDDAVLGELIEPTTGVEDRG
jgi:threonylcarbamoyladenosine tRNA methylthiotransferase MtaB